MKTSLELPGRVDLHLHSYASNVTTYYAANVFSIPESYSDPLKLYQQLKARGMSIVTLTDHNSIDGAKVLLDKGYRDIFYSAELTCRFPEDGCHVHATVANVTEAQFAEAQRLRQNVYELVAWVRQQIAEEARSPGGNRIALFMTHPLMSTENRAAGRDGALTLAHIEKAILLFDGFEVHNGSRTQPLNDLTKTMLDTLTRERIEQFANRHNIEPQGETPWRKFYTGGSDDHAGINPGRTWTEFRYEGEKPTGNDVVDSMRRRVTRAEGAHGGPVALAHSILKLLYDGSKVAKPQPTGLRGKLGLAPKPSKSTLGVSGAFTALLELVFGDKEQSLRDKAEFQVKAWYYQHEREIAARVRDVTGATIAVPFERVLEAEIIKLVADAGFRERLRGPALSTDDRIYLVVSSLVNRIFARYIENLRRDGGTNVVETIKEVVALATSSVFISLPYFSAFLAQSTDSHVATDVRAAFGIPGRRRVALFTDTFTEINGVSATIKRMIRESARRDIDFTVITALTAHERATALQDPETRRFVEQGRLKIFSAVTDIGFPEYDGLRLRFPPLLDVLRFVQEGGYTKVQLSTPATMGLTGLAVAKLLHLETAATYHTSFPEYVENYTRDIALEELAWKYMLVFYHAVDEVLVPSRFIAKLLHKRGLRNRKLLILDRWVDTARFTPDARTAGFFERYGVKDDPAVTRFVYVGRVGVEKNLALMAQAFRSLCATRRDVHLVVVGDGPFRAELEGLLKGLPVTFTGFVQGADLPKAIASCDVKVFPSMTDTWGNAPLEAESCGLPVIVSEIGGPRELMREGVTGLRVGGHDADELAAAMEVLTDRATRERMGQAARAFCEANRVDEPFTAVFDSDTYRQRIAEVKAQGTSKAVPITTEVFDLNAMNLDGSEGVAEQARYGVAA
jgi:glycosyltransferase involved in cell wall biosynthesis